MVLFDFRETNRFTKKVVDLLSDDAYAELQSFICTYPESGVVIVGSGGLRKMRWSLGSKGKRGGVRIIYYWVNERGLILMLDIYTKNEKADLTLNEISELRKQVEELSK